MTRHRKSNDVAEAAVRDAKIAAHRAKNKLKDSESKLSEAQEISQGLRNFNESNGFDKWLLAYARGE